MDGFPLTTWIPVGEAAGSGTANLTEGNGEKLSAWSTFILLGQLLWIKRWIPGVSLNVNMQNRCEYNQEFIIDLYYKLLI